MKRKLLLTILPFALLVSGCNASKNDTKEADFKNVTEEADFDDSTFLDAEVKFLDPENPPVSVADVPAIGIQSAPTANNTVSIRFVGAVRITGDWQDSDLVITWKRAAYTEDGTAQLAEANKVATKKYKNINAGGTEYSIADYNSSHNSTYTHFVTYVISNIPNTLTKAFLTASLTVNDGETVTTSKAVATSVDQTTQFSYESDVDKSFVVKKYEDGTFKTYKSKLAFKKNGSALVDELNVGFRIVDKETESIAAVYKTENKFKVLNNSMLNGYNTYFTQVGSSLFFQWSEIVSEYGQNVRLRYSESANKAFVSFGAIATKFSLTVSDAWANNAVKFLLYFAVSLDWDFDKAQTNEYYEMVETSPGFYSLETYTGSLGWGNMSIYNLGYKAVKADGTDYEQSVNNSTSNIYKQASENDSFVATGNNMQDTLKSSMSPRPNQFNYDANTSTWQILQYGVKTIDD